MKILEFFCGIGGLAEAATHPSNSIVGIDINQLALQVYASNFSHSTITATIESLTPDWVAGFQADLWWLSPPCQPYTIRGRRRDTSDPRASGLLHLIQLIPTVKPAYILLENVPAFANSMSAIRLRETLIARSYQLQEWTLCSQSFGLPNRRVRFFLAASQFGFQRHDAPSGPLGSGYSSSLALSEFLDSEPNPQFCLDPDKLKRYGRALNIVDTNDDRAVTSCFTSAYGRSLLRAGSYLRTGDSVRYFSPSEILRLLGFSAGFRLPYGLSNRQAWSLVGNSLSVPCVRHVLQSIPGLEVSNSV